jgi:hypothetical protein
MAWQSLVVFEYLKILCTENLPALQSQERNLLARLLQTMDGVINVQLCGLRLRKSEIAFLIDMCYLQWKQGDDCLIFGQFAASAIGSLI